MKKLIYSSLAVSLLAINAMAYNTDRAKELNGFYSHFTQKACDSSNL